MFAGASPVWLRAASVGLRILTVSIRYPRSADIFRVPFSPHEIFGSGWNAQKPTCCLKPVRSNAQTGQPAIEHIVAALESGAHAISANKGPIVFAYRELVALAKEKGPPIPV